MKLKNITNLCILTFALSANAYAKDIYNVSESVYIAKEHVTIKRDRTIHKTANVYWLKTKVKTIEHRKRKTNTKYYYQCWNGNGTPYDNLSQSWITTDKNLTGCPTELPAKGK
ncbi:hypothetical protein IC627_09505 [Photobacterium damselae subsp. piscicida]|uniref:Uncharacterized protein n=1 Tax=Photobacterium damsela subsp. piscicida TaxID=38294 RepID=A0A7L8A131_PHODP|nr:hypothetical protein [Photobacterium damselae]QOD51724.1 hypothetical protein IC628_09475 [Photobacterium damselae subsp. piscicida]QOD55579.1 hypothetical protein IC627_09505 [Photobacterium damselae subsp. piscicida]